jgi:hypothetical protein
MDEAGMLSIQRKRVKNMVWKESREKGMMVEEEEDRAKRNGQWARVTLLRG